VQDSPGLELGYRALDGGTVGTDFAGTSLYRPGKPLPIISPGVSRTFPISKQTARESGN
jgi:hypothetical protein